MSWNELITREIEREYRVTEGLLDLVEDAELNWKPATGANWMTAAQLLKHLAESCGVAFRGFVTGDWAIPEGIDLSQLSPEDMLPPAEKMPSVGSVAEAKKQMVEDKVLALEMLARCSEDDLAHKPAPAPWDPTEMILGHRLLEMVSHLTHHKCQLFCYLKLMAKPVHTGHLWGG